MLRRVATCCFLLLFSGVCGYIVATTQAFKPMQTAPISAADDQSHALSASALPPEAARRQASVGFGSLGRFCRAVSTVAGGLLLGSSFGIVPGVAGGVLGAAVFALAEYGARR